MLPDILYFFKDDECTILHCEDGPAVIYPSGSYKYYYEGKLHRMDGPAIFFIGMRKEYWYFHGQQAFVDTQEEFERWLKLKSFL